MALSLPLGPPVALSEDSADDVFEALYRRHFGTVWRVLVRLGVEMGSVDDAAQDVFLVVHRRSSEFGSQGAPRSWVLAVTVKVASEYRRRSARRRTEPLSETLPDRTLGPGERSELNESVRILSELLDELDDKKRTVFVLAELEQLSVVEIADTLGVNLNTAYSRLRAARHRFEAALARRRAIGPRGRG